MNKDLIYITYESGTGRQVLGIFRTLKFGMLKRADELKNQDWDNKQIIKVLLKEQYIESVEGSPGVEFFLGW